MGRCMIRVAVLVAFILVPSALPANADTVIPITDTLDGTTAGTLAVTRTNDVSPGWDEIDLNFTTWTVTFRSGAPTVVLQIVGTWSGVGGNLGVSSLGGSDWVPQTTNNNSNTLLESFVNLDSVGNQSSFARGAGSAGSYASFTSGIGGEWYTAQAHFLGPADGRAAFFPGASVDTLLSKIYVTAGADVAFNGIFMFYDGYSHSPSEDPDEVGVSFSTAIPEPPTLVLFSAAVVVGATRLWRKRR